MAGLTDNWKKFSEAFSPKNPNQMDKSTVSHKKRAAKLATAGDGQQLNAGETRLVDAGSNDAKTLSYWSAAQTALLDELSRIDRDYYVVDISMPNSGTLMHYSNNGGILTFLSLSSIKSDSIKQFEDQIKEIRLPNRIDLLYLWDAFLVYPSEYVASLLSTLLPLVALGGQINFISRTSNVAPLEPGIFSFDSQENLIYWQNFKTTTTNEPAVSNREILTMLPDCEPKKLALMDLGYQDNLYIKLTNG